MEDEINAFMIDIKNTKAPKLKEAESFKDKR